MKQYLFSFRFHIYLTNPRWRKEQLRLRKAEEHRLEAIELFKLGIANADIPALNDYYGRPIMPQPSLSPQGARRGKFERIKLGGPISGS